MCTESGAIQRIRAREQPGRILIPATMGPPAGALITTRKPAGPQLRDAVTTQIFTLGIRQAIEAAQRTTRTLESWLGVVPDMLAISIVARAPQTAGASFTTRTQTPASQRGTR